jgi:hypothetical protein
MIFNSTATRDKAFMQQVDERLKPNRPMGHTFSDGDEV